MPNELIVIDAAVAGTLAAYVVIQERIDSPVDGQIVSHVANRILEQLEPIMARAGLPAPRGSGSGPLTDLKFEYADLEQF